MSGFSPPLHWLVRPINKQVCSPLRSKASQLPDFVENLLRLFEPTLCLGFAANGMSIRVKAFSICPSDGNCQLFRRIQCRAAVIEITLSSNLNADGLNALCDLDFDNLRF
jgi:hypothetical protein